MQNDSLTGYSQSAGVWRFLSIFTIIIKLLCTSNLAVLLFFMPYNFKKRGIIIIIIKIMFWAARRDENVCA